MKEPSPPVQPGRCKLLRKYLRKLAEQFHVNMLLPRPAEERISSAFFEQQQKPSLHLSNRSASVNSSAGNSQRVHVA
jgi:hypothetical protein